MIKRITISDQVHESCRQYADAEFVVVDFGCGDGMKSTTPLRREFPNARVIAVDSSQTLLDRGNQECNTRRRLGIEFIKRDLMVGTVFPPESVDVVVINLPEPGQMRDDESLLFERMLGEAARVLKRGGEIRVKTELPSVVEKALEKVRESSDLRFAGKPPQVREGLQQFRIRKPDI